MSRRRILLRPAGERDLEQQAQYIASSSGVDVARRFYRSAEQTCPSFRLSRQRCVNPSGRFRPRSIAGSLAQRHRSDLLASLPERERFLELGYRYEEDNLLVQRAMAANRAREGDQRAATELERIKERQREVRAATRTPH